MAYIFILLIWIFLNLLFIRDKEKRVLIINAVYLSFIAGLRSVKVGTDVQTYGNIFRTFGSVPIFAEVSKSITGMPGYRLLCKIVYVVFGGNYQFMLFISSVIIAYGLIKLISSFSDKPIASVFYFVNIFYYFESMNAVRQWIAFSISLLSLVSLEKKKYIKSVVIAVFAVSVHNLVLLPILAFVIVSKVKWNKKIFIVYSAILFGTILMVDPLIKLFIHFFPRYSMYASILDNGYISGFGGGAAGTAQGRRIVISLAFLMLIFFALVTVRENKLNTGVRVDDDAKKKQSFWIFSALTMIEIVIGIVFSRNTFFLRIQSLFSPFAIIMIPSVIERLKKKWRLLAYLGTNIVFLATTAIRLTGGEAGVFPYLFFWQA